VFVGPVGSSHGSTGLLVAVTLKKKIKKSLTGHLAAGILFSR